MLNHESTPSSIEEIELPGGAVKLRRGDAATDDGTPRARQGRQAARIITMAWGQRYVTDLLSHTIPALLAPGNVPAFARSFDCEFVIVTETSLFDFVARAPAVGQLLRHGDVRLVPIDDLLSRWYGITLTYALVRGFADLGEDMVNTHLVFLNADFIVADGSYARLAEAILSGERLVVAPSYCMVQEDTLRQLRSRYDRADHTIAISRRALAEMIIEHRHNTIRAKTVNQQLFRIHRYDQFYWYVNEHTMLARQMPIAVVYMRPENVLTELRTFWDYGVISEYCPTVRPCVLADSDDFLMAELRPQTTFRELLTLGWPDAAEIAADLSSFTTKDQRDYGRHTLVLHSRDLPDGLGRATAALSSYVDKIYARLSRPVGYLDHPFWAAAFPSFIAEHREALLQCERREKAAAMLRRRDPLAAEHQARIARLKSGIRAVEAARELAAQDSGRDIRLAALDAEYRERRRALEEESAGGIRGADDATAKTLASLQGELAQLVSEERRQLGELESAAGAAADRSVDNMAAKHEAQPLVGRLAQLYRSLFGQLPRTTNWHPYHTLLQPALEAITEANNAGSILVISSGALGALLVKGLEARKLVVTPQMASAGLYRELMGAQKFGLCVCDLAFDDLFEFREVFNRIRPLLAEHARIVVFHHNSALRRLDNSTYQLSLGLFPLAGSSRVSFAGSRIGSLAMRLFDGFLHRPSSRWRLLILAVTLALSAPLARAAVAIEGRRNRRRLPSRCTSMTLVIDLP